MKHIYRQTWLSPELSGYYCDICGYETLDLDDNSVECPGNREGKYWYEYTETECVLCGRGHIEKVRKYYKKPLEYNDRHLFCQTLCGEHELYGH